MLLDFMGKVTASATHEIKNELAVINEQSRLLQEMLAMAENGREPDLARLGQLIGRVVVRVGQADQAVRRLNAFAHGADLEGGQTDPAHSLQKIMGLFQRPADMKGINLDLTVGQCPAIQVRPILWEQMVWACLEKAAEQAAKGSKLRVGMVKREGGLRVEFRLEPPARLEAPPPESFCLPDAQARAEEDGLLVLTTPLA